MLTLDANIFIRELDPNDPAYTACRDLLSTCELQRVRLMIPSLLLIEVAGTTSRVLRNPMRGRLAVDVLQARFMHNIVALDAALVELSANIAADYAIRGADAVYVATAYQTRTIFVSLDEEPRTRAAAIVQAMTPEAALALL